MAPRTKRTSEPKCGCFGEHLIGIVKLYGKRSCNFEASYLTKRSRKQWVWAAAVVVVATREWLLIVMSHVVRDLPRVVTVLLTLERVHSNRILVAAANDMVLAGG